MVGRRMNPHPADSAAALAPPAMHLAGLTNRRERGTICRITKRGGATMESFLRPLRSVACLAALFGAFALPAASQEGPKLYVFTAGSLGGFPKAALQIGGQGNIDWAPVSFYVLKHPKGNVIIDTGNNDKTITDAEGWWGPLAKGFGLKMTKDDAILVQLGKIGLKIDDIKYVVP